MLPKLLACIRFLYKVVHKVGRLQKFNRAREIEFKFLTLGLSCGKVSDSCNCLQIREASNHESQRAICLSHGSNLSQILREQPKTFVLCLYFVLYHLYHSYHARTEVSSSQSRECLDKDNINVCAVSLELNRLSISLSQTKPDTNQIYTLYSTWQNPCRKFTW